MEFEYKSDLLVFSFKMYVVKKNFVLLYIFFSFVNVRFFLKMFINKSKRLKY